MYAAWSLVLCYVGKVHKLTVTQDELCQASCNCIALSITVTRRALTRAEGGRRSPLDAFSDMQKPWESFSVSLSLLVSSTTDTSFYAVCCAWHVRA